MGVPGHGLPDAYLDGLASQIAQREEMWRREIGGLGSDRPVRIVERADTVISFCNTAPAHAGGRRKGQAAWLPSSLDLCPWCGQAAQVCELIGGRERGSGSRVCGAGRVDVAGVDQFVII